MKIFLLIGLPGSGKTHWLSNKQGIIFDDMSQIKNGMQKLEKLIKNSFQDKEQNIYISDVNFCEISTLEKAKKIIASFSPKQEIEFNYVLFISTQEISFNNVEYRQDGRNVLPTIKRFAKNIKEIQEYLFTRYQQDTEFVHTPMMAKKMQNKPLTNSK